jgi:spore germination protein YaaH
MLKNRDAKSVNLAPINWIKSTLDYYVDPNKGNKDEFYKKILLGIPFHGIFYDKNSKKYSMLDSNSYAQFLNSGVSAELKWEKTECEHLIEARHEEKELISNYPTKRFLRERLNLSKEYNLAGVAIWDIAQGLDVFLDEF